MSNALETQMKNEIFESSMDVLLALLYVGHDKGHGSIKGTTRLTKIMFLVQQETSLKKYMEDLHFANYNYGVYSSDLYDSILTLIQLNLICTLNSYMPQPLEEVDRFEVEQGIEHDIESSKATLIYHLTDTGKKVSAELWAMLTKEEQTELWTTKQRYNHLNLSQVIHYTYLRYPVESGIPQKLKLAKEE